MNTYIKRQLSLLVSEQQNGIGELFKRGDAQTKFDVVTGLDKVFSKGFALAIPQTNLDLMSGSGITTGRLLYIETDTELTIKLGTTGDTAVTVKPPSTTERTTKRAVCYIEGSFTHVYASIAGVSGTANVVIGIVGT